MAGNRSRPRDHAEGHGMHGKGRMAEIDGDQPGELPEADRSCRMSLTALSGRARQGPRQHVEGAICCRAAGTVQEGTPWSMIPARS